MVGAKDGARAVVVAVARVGVVVVIVHGASVEARAGLGARVIPAIGLEADSEDRARGGCGDGAGVRAWGVATIVVTGDPWVGAKDGVGVGVVVVVAVGAPADAWAGDAAAARAGIVACRVDLAWAVAWAGIGTAVWALAEVVAERTPWAGVVVGSVARARAGDGAGVGAWAEPITTAVVGTGTKAVASGGVACVASTKSLYPTTASPCLHWLLSWDVPRVELRPRNREMAPCSSCRKAVGLKSGKSSVDRRGRWENRHSCSLGTIPERSCARSLPNQHTNTPQSLLLSCFRTGTMLTSPKWSVGAFGSMDLLAIRNIWILSHICREMNAAPPRPELKTHK